MWFLSTSDDYARVDWAQKCRVLWVMGLIQGHLIPARKKQQPLGLQDLEIQSAPAWGDNPGDFHCRMKLVSMVCKRRKLLDRLSEKNLDSYMKIREDAASLSSWFEHVWKAVFLRSHGVLASLVWCGTVSTQSTVRNESIPILQVLVAFKPTKWPNNGLQMFLQTQKYDFASCQQSTQKPVA